MGNSCRPRQYSHLSAGEAEDLTKLIAITEKVTKKFHQNISNIPSRQKHISLLTWLFGWRTYTHTRNMYKKKTQQNVQILKDQNSLQEFQILELQHYLNLTMVCHATITNCTVDNLVALLIIQCVNA